MSNDVTAKGNGVSPDATRDAVRQRVREFRKRKQLGITLRTIRTNRKHVTKLISLGYLDFDRRGDEKAEAIAIEAYLRDNIG